MLGYIENFVSSLLYSSLTAFFFILLKLSSGSMF